MAQFQIVNDDTNQSVTCC